MPAERIHYCIVVEVGDNFCKVVSIILNPERVPYIPDYESDISTEGKDGGIDSPGKKKEARSFLSESAGKQNG